MSRPTVADHYRSDHKSQTHDDILASQCYTLNPQVMDFNSSFGFASRMWRVSDPRNPGKYIDVFNSFTVKNGNGVASVKADMKDPRCKGLK